MKILLKDIIIDTAQQYDSIEEQLNTYRAYKYKKKEE